MVAVEIAIGVLVLGAVVMLLIAYGGRARHAWHQWRLWRAIQRDWNRRREELRAQLPRRERRP